MTTALPQRSNDPGVSAFIDAATDADAESALEVLLHHDVGPLAREVVTRRLARSSRLAGHIDDVIGDVQVALTRKLWSLRSRIGEPVGNLRAYVVTTSERACYSFMRQQFPERTRLRNRLRYALTHHAETSLIEDAHGVWWCNATLSRRPRRAGSVQVLLSDPRGFATDHHVDLSRDLVSVAVALLASCDLPVEFNRFVDALASLLGISDAAPPTRRGASSAQGTSDVIEQAADPAPLVTAVLEQRTSVRELWLELVALPVRQRAALLLNLRDPEGGGPVLHLLPATGLVSQADIAAALELRERDLAELWPHLPLDDQSIATRFGISRQQVINLRKSGRARLARRLSRNVR